MKNACDNPILLTETYLKPQLLVFPLFQTNKEKQKRLKTSDTAYCNFITFEDIISHTSF